MTYNMYIHFQYLTCAIVCISGYKIWIAQIHKVYKSQACDQEPITQVTGSKSWTGYCPGDDVFWESFDDILDFDTWKHELWPPGTVNNEFQEYVQSWSNSYTLNGNLHITATADESAQNHIHSARMITADSFAFKYGKFEARAKMPNGDWLWPAIWLLPKDSVYGQWPASGEIDVVESRGNQHLYYGDWNFGDELMGVTLHFGPDPSHNGFMHAHCDKNSAPGQGWDKDFHRYQLEWTPDYIKVSIDDAEICRVTPGDGGFYELGDGELAGANNPWANSGKMAPFDQFFYIIMNVAVGGDYFPDDATNQGGKPWSKSEGAGGVNSFWNGRNQWLPTWDVGEDQHLQVDYVKVTAI